jgi:D-3-phosphoglycerate dehydrogenase
MEDNDVKLVGIGELFIPHQHIRKGFASFTEKGVRVETLDWKLSGFQELQNINHLVEKAGSDAYDPPAYIYEAARDADILVTEFCPVGKKLIDSCRRLKAIGVLRAGVENVNVAHATERNVLVYNTPGRNSDSVADFTIGMIISECRNIARGHHGLKNGRWIREYPNQGRIPDLPGKIVGLVGLGEIGEGSALRCEDGRPGTAHGRVGFREHPCPSHQRNGKAHKPRAHFTHEADGLFHQYVPVRTCG